RRGPRARGDGPEARKSLQFFDLRAPRTRGWTGRPGCWSHIDLESPAHAGMDRVRGVEATRKLERAPRTRGWTAPYSRAHFCPQESPAHAGMGRTGVTEDALLIMGEITTNALLRTPPGAARGGCRFGVLLFVLPVGVGPLS